MLILNPEERLAAEQRVAEIERELISHLDQPQGLQADRAAALRKELADLQNSLVGVRPV